MKKKGFTLIELMITLTIFAIFSVYLYQTFFSQIRQSFSLNNNIDVQYNVNKSLNMLTDNIRSYSSTNGTKILKSSDGSKSISINQNGEIQVNSINDNGNIVNVLSNFPEPSSSPPADIQYDSINKTLYFKNDSQNKCFNIDSVDFSTENKNGIIVITVSVLKGNVHIESSTAVNVKK